MKRISTVSFLSLLVMCLLFLPAFTWAQEASSREPDSEYVEKGREPESEEGGGLFDFLPFVGGGQKKIELERLVPTPKPERSKPVFSKRNMEELQATAGVWLLSSEFTEPTVRQDGEGKYYRDYIIFGDEYEAEVVRGDAEDKPFVGHIYIKGDYFKTRSHDTAEDARSDFKFKYQPRDFRVVFNRTEKWEYSDDPNSDPFLFVQRWEFHNLQSRFAVDFSEEGKREKPDAGSADGAAPPEPQTTADE
jgi:hypothetical protein